MSTIAFKKDGYSFVKTDDFQQKSKKSQSGHKKKSWPNMTRFVKSVSSLFRSSSQEKTLSKKIEHRIQKPVSTKVTDLASSESFSSSTPSVTSPSSMLTIPPNRTSKGLSFIDDLPSSFSGPIQSISPPSSFLDIEHHIQKPVSTKVTNLTTSESFSSSTPSVTSSSSMLTIPSSRTSKGLSFIDDLPSPFSGPIQPISPPSSYTDLLSPVSPSKRSSSFVEQSSSIESSQDLSKKKRIIHIGQLHKNTFGNVSKKKFERIVKSQLKVIQVIKRYPDCPIAMEGRYVSLSRHPDSSDMELAKRIFPKGIPATIDELDESQKQFLYLNGGPETLWFLGQIPSLYRGASKEVEDEAEKFVTSEMQKESDFEDIYDPTTETYKILRTNREEALVKCVHEDCPDHDTVLVVYGNSHDFSDVCKKNGLLLETINTDR